MKNRICMGILFLVLSAVARAEPGEKASYGKVTSGYMWPGGNADLIGTTRSVYGGTPGFDMHDGASFSLAAGYRLPIGWRIEGELSVLRAATDTGYVNGFEQRSEDTFRLDGEVESTVFLLNALIDLDVGNDSFSPYLKLGAGIARNEAAATLDVRFDAALWNGTALEGASLYGHDFPGGRETSFAWNVAFGLNTPLTDRLLLGLEYGFIDLGEAATGIDENNDAILWSDLSGQRFLLGLDFRF